MKFEEGKFEQLVDYPNVYVFLSDSEQPLYIGSSGTLIRCMFSSPRELKRHQAFQVKKSIKVFRCKTLADARRMERRLIYKYHPAYNTRCSPSVSSFDVKDYTGYAGLDACPHRQLRGFCADCRLEAKMARGEMRTAQEIIEENKRRL